VLVFWDQPTGKVIIGITLGVLVALVIIEFLGRPPSLEAHETPEVETAAVPETAPAESETAPAESESAVGASGVRDSV
jgi:hypothetical protein